MYTFVYPRRLKTSVKIVEEGKNRTNQWRGRTMLRRSNSPPNYYNRINNRQYRHQRHRHNVDFYKLENERRKQLNVSDNSTEFHSNKLTDCEIFESSDTDFVLPTIGFPVDMFLRLVSNNHAHHSRNDLPPIVQDTKAHKYFEYQHSDVKQESFKTDEQSLCSIDGITETEFLSFMQHRKSLWTAISQANISPSVFIQQSNTLSVVFAVVYHYCRSSSCVNVTIKFSSTSPPTMTVDNACLEAVVNAMERWISNEQTIEMTKKASSNRKEVYGSFPLPLAVTEKMLIARSQSCEQQTAFLHEEATHDQQQWFNTVVDYELIDCPICCESLSTKNAFQLLPCA